MLGPTLVIGQRTNVRENDKLRQYQPDDIPALAHRQRAKLFWFSAEDYFIMSAGGYPWHRVPRDVVVGRVGYDNFLVFNALRHKVSVVDATRTVLAVHQTDADGNMAGHRGKHAAYNLAKIGRFNWRAGLTTSSQYITRFANDSDSSTMAVAVSARPRPTNGKSTAVAGRKSRRYNRTETKSLKRGSSTRRSWPRARRRKQPSAATVIAPSNRLVSTLRVSVSADFGK